MKKSTVLLTVSILAIAAFAFASELMHARQAWLGAINKNLDTKNFEVVAKDADALAAQTLKSGETHSNPLGKEITLAISTLAKEISTAAAAQNGDTVKVKLGEIKTKCGECHAKFRNK
ncbi:MAG: hypothetical protein V2B19_17835 [Pseudomonadota bacterium]